MKTFILSLFLLVAHFSISLAEGSSAYHQSDYTKAVAYIDQKSVQSGQSFWILLQLNHQPGWHSYWKNPGESGLATRFKWQLPPGLKVKEIFMAAPDLFYLDTLVNYGYKKQANFLIQMQVDPSLQLGDYPFSFESHWLACETVCVPEKANLNLSFNVAETGMPSKYFSKIESQKERILNRSTLQLKAEKQADKVLLALPQSFVGLNQAYFFSDTPGDFYITKSQSLNTENGLKLELISNLLKSNSFSGLLMIQRDAQSKKEYFQVNASLPSETLSLFWVLIMALLGGFLLNLMPCVFPVLSLKVLAFFKQKSKYSPFKHGLFYSLGILLSFYVLVALLQFLKLAGAQIGWGFQLQSPLFILSLLAVMVTVTVVMAKLSKESLGLNQLQGFFARLLPQTVNTELLGSFMTGVLAVFVATPCTAPFMAPAIGYGLSQSFMPNLAVFTALGLGMSFPFLMIGILPKSFWLKMPKPGPWMLRLQQFLAIPMALTAIWLAWILLGQISLIAWFFAILLIFVLIFFLLDIFPIQNKGVKLTLYLVLASIFFALFMINSRVALNTQTFSVSALKQQLEQGDVKIFVDVTARWCLTCKVNENLVLKTPEITEWFTQQGIQLKILDWTQQDADITQYIQSFKREGVPLYVYYDKQGTAHVLPQVLTKESLKAALTAFDKD